MHFCLKVATFSYFVFLEQEQGFKSCSLFKNRSGAVIRQSQGNLNDGGKKGSKLEYKLRRVNKKIKQSSSN
jgi:hypothetical protein